MVSVYLAVLRIGGGLTRIQSAPPGRRSASRPLPLMLPCVRKATIRWLLPLASGMTRALSGDVYILIVNTCSSEGVMVATCGAGNLDSVVDVRFEKPFSDSITVKTLVSSLTRYFVYAVCRLFTGPMDSTGLTTCRARD